VPLPSWSSWHFRSKPRSTEAYAFAVCCIVAASLVRWAFGLLGEDVFVFASYYPAVLFATYVGGAAVGCFTALLSAVIAWWAFLPPHFAYTALTPGIGTKLLAFLLASALIIWGANRYRWLLRRLEAEEELRELAVGELAHRLKNKIATIQSVIGAKLRNEPQIKSEILGLLSSLSATDDLIMATQGNGANIRDIFDAETRCYDNSRISLQGPDVMLPPKPAMTMALVVHELATNSAKYGALSAPSGKLAICWAGANGKMTIDWRESDGPAVVPSTHRGFGTRLLCRALQQFGGAIQSRFEPTGLICEMSLILPREPAAVPKTSTPKVPQAQVPAIELPSVQPDRYS
jgi:two-component sensor histidine kinase